MSPRWAALLLVFAGAGARAGSWSDFWLTPEQQGQRALEAGHAREAAQMFSDPRRRGYAELEAKDYEAAQKALEPLTDAESQYNRGNALARAGNLRPALDAYDASLKHTEANAALRRDAQHNRDLVAKQLEQQSGQQGAQGGKPDKSPDAAGQDQKGRPQNGQPNQEPQQNRTPDSKESAQSNTGDQGQSRKADESQNGGNRPEGGGQEAPGSQSGRAQDRDAANADARQAQRDAAQALEQAKQQAGQPDQTSPSPPRSSARVGGDHKNGPVQSEPAAPPTEQTLALDQWLRQIPDDPGGLLRRKFLIEHMIKQNAGGAP
jgi:Ca-activated chloride channel homolog